jgi:hypothetical protein
LNSPQVEDPAVVVVVVVVCVVVVVTTSPAWALSYVMNCHITKIMKNNDGILLLIFGSGFWVMKLDFGQTSSFI